MALLRLLLAGLVALAAMTAVVVTAIVVVLTGIAGWVMQLFRGKPASSRPAPVPPRRPVAPSDDVIDVVATKVPDDAGRN